MAILPTRSLPGTGQELTVLGLGCAPLGGLFEPVSEDVARGTVQAAWDRGVRFFDTAPFYGYGLSEHRLGHALRERPREQWHVSSKAGRLLIPRVRGARPATPRPPGDAWAEPLPFEPRFDYSAAGLRRSVEDSLQRLGLNWLDILLVHDIGELTHGAAHGGHWQALTGGGFAELQAMREEGLVGAVGLGVNEWQVAMQALEHVRLDCCLLAGRYTLLEQGALRPFLETCQARRIAVIIGGPFNSGVLAGPDVARAHFDYQTVPPAVSRKVLALRAVCEPHAVPLGAAALQFPLAHPAVISCLPGARSPEELKQVIDWYHWPVPPALWSDLKRQRLLEAQAPVPGERDAD